MSFNLFVTRDANGNHAVVYNGEEADVYVRLGISSSAAKSLPASWVTF